MKRIQIYSFLFFLIGFTSHVFSQETDFARFFSSSFENVSSITVEPNCGVSGPYSFPIEVSGLPLLNGRLQFDRIELGLINTDANYELEITLVSPNGTQYTIADTDGLGSWPTLIDGQQSIYIFNCPGLYPNDNSPMHQFNPADELFAVNGYEMPNMTGTDPNGLWNLLICNRGNEDIAILNTNLAFKSVQSYGGINNVSNAADCQSNGTVQYFISQGGCDAVRHLFLGFDDEPLEYVIYDPLDLNGIVSNRELGPGSHVMSVYGAIDDVSPDYDFVRTYHFDLGLDVEDTESPELINCPADTLFYFTTNDTVPVPLMFPTFADNCEVVEATLITRLLDGLKWAVGGPDIDTTNFFEIPGNSVGTGLVGTGRARLDFWVTDAAGNTATCRTTFTIRDSIACANDTEAPELIHCPSDSLYYSVNDTTVTWITHPTFTDNCQVVTATYLITMNGTSFDDGESGPFLIDFIDFPGETNSGTVVGTGTVRLDYSIADAAGNTDECSVTLTFVEGNDPCLNDTEDPIFIDCPGDQTVILDDNGSGIFNLTDPNFSDNCTIVTEYLEIDYRGGATDGGNGIEGVYTELFPGTNLSYPIEGIGTVEFDFQVTDQAGNTGQCVVVITSKEPTGPCDNDVTLPVLTNCQANSVVVLDRDNQAVVPVVAPDAIDNCGIQTRLVEVTYSGGATDENGNTSRSFINFNDGAMRDFTIIGAGTLTIEFLVSDPFGNTNSCITTISSIFGGTEVLFDITEECIIPGERLSLPVRVTNFTDIGAFSFDLRLPENSGLSFIGIEDETISNTSFNVLADNNLRIGWDDPAGNDVSLENNTRIFNVVISAAADFSSAVTITSQDVVVLQQGVVVTGRVDLATICVGSGVTPSGRIYNPLNKAHAQVLVNLIGGSNVVDNIMSDTQGGYSFSTTNNTFRITPFKNDELTKGITIADVARIRRHFLQKNILDSEYKILAADVNKDGKINIIDVAFTNRVFLRKLDHFPGNTAWRFVPVAADIRMNPLNVNIPNTIHLNGSGLDFENLDFYSIKTGDVDYSALNNVKSHTDDNRFSMALSIPDTVLAPQEMIDMPVYLSGDENISALSFNMQYDTAILELIAISSTVLDGFSAGSYNDIDGNVLIGWDHPQGNAINAEGVLMMMTFRNKVSVGRSEILLENASLFDRDLNAINVSTQSGSVDFMTSSVNGIYTDYHISANPNPFMDAVMIEVKTSTPQQLKIKFTNVSGDLLKEMITDNKSKDHLITIDDIMAKGVIMVFVEGENFTEVLKLIKL